jgi:dCTP deaminase
LILTGSEILKQYQLGRITIDPFDESQLNPNSYNFRLGNRIKTYRADILDVRQKLEVDEHLVGDDGFVLRPGRVYLGHTEEVMGSDHYVPILRGRSSTARLGLFVHVTADLIDIGSHNQWTLQLVAAQPVLVLPRMLIGQVTFWTVAGEIVLYNGKYQGSRGPWESQIYKDLKGASD